MLSKKVRLASAATLIAGAAFASHIPVALSYLHGVEILDEVVVIVGTNQTGVPAYEVATEEHDDAVVGLTDGASFSVGTGSTAETVVFSSSDFEDIGNATADEVVAAINGQLRHAVAMNHNGHFILHGLEGGPSSQLMLTDGPGNPLDAMHLPTGMESGSDTIRLELSVPSGHDDEDHDPLTHQSFPHHPYLLLASTTEGSFVLDGHEVPIARDATTSAFLKAARLGVVGGFVGQLDENSDAQAKLPLQTLADILGTDLRPASFGGTLSQTPPEGDVYFAYVVFDEAGDHVVFVSNVFTVRIQQQP